MLSSQRQDSSKNLKRLSSSEFSADDLNGAGFFVLLLLEEAAAAAVATFLGVPKMSGILIQLRVHVRMECMKN